MTNLNLPAAAANAPAPIAAGDAAGAAQPVQDLALAGVPAAPGAVQGAPAQPAFAFAQWLGLEQLAPAAAGAPVDMTGLDSVVGVDIAAPVAPIPGTDTPPDEQQTSMDNTLLGAMAMPMPLMPVAQATLAAVVAALPGVPVPKEAQPASDTAVSLPVTQGAARRDAHGERAEAVLAGALPVAPAAAAAPAPVAPAPLATAQHAPAPAALPKADALAASAEAPQDTSAVATERSAANTAGIAAPATSSSMRSADTVTLSGPPTAWRQTLQEALGERLQLQVGKNAEQAVIRLEPPMLGRVEIAIRHSAGSLEVHISATHGEVLRQLQTVGENLRNDLAQRQFTDVSVNIAAAPRGAAASANSMFAGDNSGRGRQQDGRQEEQQPGNALAEAHTGAVPFSLNGSGNRRA